MGGKLKIALEKIIKFAQFSSFKVFKIEDKKVIEEDIIDSIQNHKPGDLPNLLKEHDIDVIIADGIGKKAIEIFNQFNINVIFGIQGSIKEALDNFMNGKLESKGNVCSH